MGTLVASLRHGAWRLWSRHPPATALAECAHLRRLWRRLRGRDCGIRLEGARYCLDHCLEVSLRRALERALPGQRRGGTRHRVPLGLVLLSQQHLSIEQLRAALAAQQKAGCGRIGEWIATLGFANEQQITAALARQWGCPVLRRTPAMAIASAGFAHIPLALLEKFSMLPVSFSAAASSLHIAFADGVDHSALYAIEQMTGRHTEPCLALPSFVQAQLSRLALDRSQTDLTFDRIADHAEISRIIRSYCGRTGASEIRLAACPPYLWVRLLLESDSLHDLVLRLPETPGAVSLEDCLDH